MNSTTASEEIKLADSNGENVVADPSSETAVPLPADSTIDPPSPQTEPQPELSETVGQFSPTVLNEMNERIETLARLLEEANRLSMERERIIDRLHGENQSLKQGELQQALLPVLRDSIRLFDDLHQTANNYAERENLVPANVARDFECFAETVSDILYRHGVERYAAAEGEAFNSKEHRVLGVVKTSVKEKDRTIARTIHEGFRSNVAIVRLLEAEVYRYVPDAGVKDEPDAAPTQ